MTNEDKLKLKKLITEYFQHCSKLPHNNDIRMWGKELMHYEVEDLNVAFKHAMDVSAYLATPKQIVSFTIEFKAIRVKAEDARHKTPTTKEIFESREFSDEAMINNMIGFIHGVNRYKAEPITDIGTLNAKGRELFGNSFIRITPEILAQAQRTQPRGRR